MNDQIKFHISLNVTDINQTIEFYRNLFNQEPVKQKEDYAKFELDEPGLVISFIESPSNVLTNFGHLGLRVVSEEQLRTRKQEIEAKLQIGLEERNTNCCYARQDKFWVADPDGYQWEVYHFKKDMAENKVAHEAAPCC